MDFILSAANGVCDCWIPLQALEKVRDIRCSQHGRFEERSVRHCGILNYPRARRCASPSRQCQWQTDRASGDRMPSGECECVVRSPYYVVSFRGRQPSWLSRATGILPVAQARCLRARSAERSACKLNTMLQTVSERWLSVAFSALVAHPCGPAQRFDRAASLSTELAFLQAQ